MIFLYENCQILIEFVAMGPIKNKPSMIEIFVWRQTEDKPLPESIMT